ncbi:MAG: DUF4197 domain-containing protein [Bacteroidetes bacterium]|nr:DUF4197 domain-containing protein [Bacteroidota bacterium]
MITAQCANAQINKWIDKANDAINGNSGNNNNGRPGSNQGSNQGGQSLESISNNEIVCALKEALQVGARNATGRLNVMNGFFGNQLIKILMPPEAKQMESTLRSMGLGPQVDKAILSMNRAAEDASGQAVNIFINAITSMSIQDAIGIVRGGQGAATNYLKQRTTQQLTDAFRPIIQNSLNKVGATRYWSDIFTTYNKIPLVTKVNPDLVAYVTERALNGLFVTIADEENKIRLNPGARVSDLLKKVFGAR